VYPVTEDFQNKISASERQVFGRVVIDYTSPFLDESIEVSASEQANASFPAQTADSVPEPFAKIASLDGSWVLDGSYTLAPATSEEAETKQLGWWGKQLAGTAGAFVAPYPTLTVTFFSRPITRLQVVGDSKRGEYPVDFTIRLYDGADTLLHTETVTGNSAVTWSKTLSSAITQVTKMELEITRWSHASRQVKILEFFTSIQETYEGDDIIFIHLLEEREASQGSLPVGVVTSNELDIRLDNSNRKFDAGNTASPLYNLLKPNRRIRAWLGVESGSGEKEMVPLGTFWSGDWSAPEDGIYAQTTGRDRLELLRRSEFRTRVLSFDGANNHLFINIRNIKRVEIDMIKFSAASNDYVADFRPDTNAYLWGSAGTGALTAYADDVQIASTMDIPINQRVTVSLVLNAPTSGTMYLMNRYTTDRLLKAIVYGVSLYDEDGNLVNHYNLNEGSGTTAYDDISYNHGIICGATWTDGLLPDQSLHGLAERVLIDAGLTPDEYWVDDELQEYVIPYVVLEPQSHREALRKIAEACLGQVYCDRLGVIRVEGTKAIAELKNVEVSEQANISYPDQITSETEEPSARYASLDGSWELDGSFELAPTSDTGDFKMGWWGSQLADAAGYFTQPYPLLSVSFAQRAIGSVRVVGDSTRGECPVDFSIIVYDAADSILARHDITGNDQVARDIPIPENPTTATKVMLEVQRWSHPGRQAKIVRFDEVPFKLGITPDDCFRKDNPARYVEMANYIEVTTQPIDAGGNTLPGIKVIAKDEVNIVENGLLKYEFPANPFVQTVEMAQEMADRLLAGYKDALRNLELEWRGNPALLLGDVITVQDGREQNNYRVARQEIEYSGALRAQLSGRRV
jgi:hypothetical protein